MRKRKQEKKNKKEKEKKNKKKTDKKEKKKKKKEQKKTVSHLPPTPTPLTDLSHEVITAEAVLVPDSDDDGQVVVGGV